MSQNHLRKTMCMYLGFTVLLRAFGGVRRRSNIGWVEFHCQKIVQSVFAVAAADHDPAMASYTLPCPSLPRTSGLWQRIHFLNGLIYF